MTKKIEAIRIIEFDAGHRIMRHESKCATCHGHRYKAELYAEAKDLDGLGRVIDFSVLKEKIGFWIDECWDHNFILFKDDVETIKALSSIPRKKDPFILDSNPTAENMATYLLKEVCPEMLKGTGVKVTKIRLWETPNCYVEVTSWQG